MQADPELAGSLFTEDCRYFETPYSEPAVGREGVRRYWQAVPDAQRDVRFDYAVLAVGIVIVFGVSFATLLTLFVVPAMYALLARDTQTPEHVEKEIEKLRATR